MDRLESLGNSLSQITMYDIKSVYNQAKNMVLNVTEMEAKVREATNDDPWGASSTLMQEIAQGTFNFQHFNEIMPCIYSRFMDKEARQWREIYKALQLLEYIIKHGSERVVDDARSHLSTIKMLRNFHYIDEKGKDQGINVRNRAKEIAEMLMDVEKIRAERRKAKANRNKYIGTGNDAMSFSGGGGRYGGFGSDSPSGGSGSGGGYSGSYDRENSGSSGAGGGGFRDESANKRGYDEYDAGEYDASPRRSSTVTGRSGSGAGAGSSGRSPTAVTPAPAKEVPKQPEVDLLGGFGDDDVSVSAGGTNKALPAVTPPNPLDGDDDFDDFQTAPPSAPAAKPTVFEFLNATSMQPSTAPAPQTTFRSQQTAVPPPQQHTGFGAGGFPALSPTANRQTFGSATQSPPMYGSQQVMSPTSQPMRPTHASTPSFGSSYTGGTMAPAKPAATTSASKAAPAASVGFDDLWNLSLGASSGNKTVSSTGKSIKDLEKEKAQAGIWGASGTTSQGGLSAFGSFGTTSGGSAPTSSGANDDLLL